MKISIIGYSGSGKSTLASQLAIIYDIKCLHLDTVRFLPNWVERQSQDERQIVFDFLQTNSSWIIDGNYQSLYRQERLEQSDCIIFLNFNRFSCLYRACKRYNKYKNISRPSITIGCKEKFDKEFFLWIMRDGRTKNRKNDYKAIINKYKEKVVVLTNQRQLDKYVAKVKSNIVF
ncbi:MAG: DNA topology modulation protein [Clostridia bacterium]